MPSPGHTLSTTSVRNSLFPTNLLISLTKLLQMKTNKFLRCYNNNFQSTKNIFEMNLRLRFQAVVNICCPLVYGNAFRNIVDDCISTHCWVIKFIPQLNPEFPPLFVNGVVNISLHNVIVSPKTKSRLETTRMLLYYAFTCANSKNISERI